MAQRKRPVLSRLMRPKSLSGLKCDTLSSFGAYQTRIGMFLTGILFQAALTMISTSNS